MLYKIQKFTDTTYFITAIKVTIAVVIPVLTFSLWGKFEVGFAIAQGAFFTYPSDILSSLKHKIYGILVSAVLVASINLIVNIVYPYSWIFYPFLTILIFLLSMLPVYGQRGTMISFSSLVCVSLSFANISSGWNMVQHSGLILAGGLFYLLISLIFHYIRPYRYIELQSYLKIPET